MPLRVPKYLYRKGQELKAGFGPWWRQYAGSVAFLVTISFTAGGFYAITQEKNDRQETVAGVINLFCDINNRQDQTLAQLIAVSVGQGAQGQFGAGVDPDQLSSFDLKVIAAINAVQNAQSPDDSNFQHVFEATQRALENLTPCDLIIQRYKTGGNIPQLDDIDPQPVEKP